MDIENKKELIDRIRSGYVILKDYIIDIPSPRILNEANNLYLEFLHENRFEDILDNDSLDFLLLKNGIISVFDQNKLKEIPKKIDNAKLQLFKDFMLPSKRKYIKQEIENLRKEQNLIYNKRYPFEKYTIEYLAEKIRNRHIFSNVVLNKKYKKIKIKSCYIDFVINKFNEDYISITEYRQLARNSEWTNIWYIFKNKSFRKIGIEQQNLISYTKLYENVNKHPERPDEMIIQDDDALDGWLIDINNKNKEKEKSNNSQKNKKDHNEHFIIANDEEDIKSIIGMNDTTGKIIQKKIHKMTQQTGFANELHIQEIAQNAKIIHR